MGIVGVEDKFFGTIALAEGVEYPATEVHHVEGGENEHIIDRLVEMLQFNSAVNHIVQANSILVYSVEGVTRLGVVGALLEDAHRTYNHRQRGLEVV